MKNSRISREVILQLPKDNIVSLFHVFLSFVPSSGFFYGLVITESMMHKGCFMVETGNVSHLNSKTCVHKKLKSGSGVNMKFGSSFQACATY